MESVSSAQTIEKGCLLLGKMLLAGNMRVGELCPTLIYRLALFKRKNNACLQLWLSGT